MELNDEEFYRRIKNIPEWMKDGKITSAVFKDSKGVSVNKRSGRDENKVIRDEEALHDMILRKKYGNSVPRKEQLIALVKVTKAQCDERQILTKEDSLQDNENHVLIIRSDEKMELTSGQAKHLANSSKIVKSYK